MTAKEILPLIEEDNLKSKSGSGGHSSSYTQHGNFWTCEAYYWDKTEQGFIRGLLNHMNLP